MNALAKLTRTYLWLPSRSECADARHHDECLGQSLPALRQLRRGFLTPANAGAGFVFWKVAPYIDKERIIHLKENSIADLRGCELRWRDCQG